MTPAREANGGGKSAEAGTDDEDFFHSPLFSSAADKGITKFPNFSKLTKRGRCV
jgi:hypothetical protein